MSDMQKRKNRKTAQKCKEQLGMSHGAASSKLKKALLFRFVKMAGEDICYRCENRIENLDEFSVEHKIPWLDSEDPCVLFFDLENIAYSHHKCNCGATRRTKAHEEAVQNPSPYQRAAWDKTIEATRQRNEKNALKIENGVVGCKICGERKSVSEFTKRSNRSSGIRGECLECRRERRS